uniref:Major facilitator superfamily (MFS) profile domain-containing protein n=1 Tax=Varanus komodoensis TaxID=61221 RepID=A0A8D2LGN8_VARKO
MFLHCTERKRKKMTTRGRVAFDRSTDVSWLLEHFYNKSTFEELTEPNSQMLLIGITIALFPFGGIFGALTVGCLLDTFGRKNSLMIASIFSTVSAILMGCSNLIYAFEYTMFARLYTGICAGILSGVVPLYLGEISPRNLRGCLVMMPHFFTTVGVLLSRFVSLHNVLGNQEGWPILMGVIGIIPGIQMFLVPFYPESPGYLLIQKGDEEKARQALQKLRDKEDVEDEMEELRQEDIAEKAEKEMTCMKLIQTESLRRQVVTTIVLMSGQQLAGLNAVREASLSQAMYLADSVGRRVLILIGFVCCTITCVLLTMTLELQGDNGIQCFNVSNSFSIEGPVPSVLVVEIFFQSSRASAYVIAGFTKWFLSFLTGVSFLQIQNRLGSYSFFIFWPICIATFYYIFKFVPETKQKTYMDIRRIMAKHTSRRIKVKKHGGK